MNDHTFQKNEPQAPPNGFIFLESMVMQYDKGKHCVFYHRYHVVWSTKYRFKILRGDIQRRVHEIIRRVCCENGVDIISGVVSTDHVHIFVSIPPKLSMSDFMRKVKGRSSFLIQREFPALKKRYWGQRFWGRDYFSTTTGPITEDTVLQYLENHVQNPTGARR
jgi:putative transposase